MAATKSKILKYTGTLFSLLLFSAALWVLHREMQTVHLQRILSELEAIPGKRLWLAAILTVSSYTIMAGYDYLAIRFIKHSLSLTRIVLASFIGNAFSNNIGFSILAGASVRYRLYSNWGLSVLEIAKVVAFYTLTQWLGFQYWQHGPHPGADGDSTRVVYSFSYNFATWRSVLGRDDGLLRSDRLSPAASAFQGMGNHTPIFAYPLFSDPGGVRGLASGYSSALHAAAFRAAGVFPKFHRCVFPRSDGGGGQSDSRRAGCI